MGAAVFGIVYCWIILSIWAISLILIRDDGDYILTDIELSFKEGFVYGLAHIIILLLYAPLTLPYSIKYFIDKWK